MPIARSLMADILSRPRVERTLGTEVTATVGCPLRAKDTWLRSGRQDCSCWHDSRIEIVVFAGRSLDVKRAQYQVLVANLSALEV